MQADPWRRLCASPLGNRGQSAWRSDEDGTDGSRRVAVYRCIEREETASTAQPRYWKGVRARVHARIIIDPWIEMKRSGNPE